MMSMQGLDPQMLAQMMGGGQGSFPDQAPGEPGPGGGSEDQPISILKQMIDLARSYLDVEPDEEDKATMAKLLATLQQYLAKDQQDSQTAMGGNPAVARVLRKAG